MDKQEQFGIKYSPEMNVWVVRSFRTNHKKVITQQDLLNCSFAVINVFRESREKPGAEITVLIPS